MLQEGKYLLTVLLDSSETGLALKTVAFEVPEGTTESKDLLNDVKILVDKYNILFVERNNTVVWRITDMQVDMQATENSTKAKEDGCDYEGH